MARVLQVKRGLKANIPTLAQGEFGFTTDVDAEELHIGNGTKNIQVATITNKSNGHHLRMNGGKSEVQSYNTSTNITARSVAGDDTNLRKLAVYSALGKANKSECVVLVEAVDGTETQYKIYGEHNKPTAADIGAAAASHTHSEYAAANHSHSGYAASSHTHTKSQITDFPSTMTPSAHNQAASTITAGTFAGQVVANSGGETYSTYLLRNTCLASSDTTPSTNGEICWTYG